MELPRGLTTIGDCALEGCTALRKILISSTVKSIKLNSFKYCSAISIYGEKGGYAEKYAAAAGIPFGDMSVYASESMVFTNALLFWMLLSTRYRL